MQRLTTPTDDDVQQQWQQQQEACSRLLPLTHLFDEHKHATTSSLTSDDTQKIRNSLRLIKQRLSAWRSERHGDEPRDKHQAAATHDVDRLTTTSMKTSSDLVDDTVSADVAYSHRRWIR